MRNPYYFTDRILKIALKNVLVSHHIIHFTSKTTTKPKYSKIETRYVKKYLNNLATLNARLINRYKLKIQTVFSAKFDQQDEDGQILIEIGLFSNLKKFRILKKKDIDNFNVRFQLEHQNINHETKVSGWSFDKIFSKTTCFYNTTERDGSSYAKTPLRSSAVLNIGKKDKFSFLSSFQLVYIFVAVIILKEFELDDNNSMNQTFKFSKSQMSLNVLMFIKKGKLKNLSLNIF